MKPVKLYSADWCPYCQRAKSLLEDKNIPFEEINVDKTPGLREKISAQTGFRTIPQIFIGDKFIGGYTDLAELDNSGELDKLLA